MQNCERQQQLWKRDNVQSTGRLCLRPQCLASRGIFRPGSPSSSSGVVRLPFQTFQTYFDQNFSNISLKFRIFGRKRLDELVFFAKTTCSTYFLFGSLIPFCVRCSFVKQYIVQKLKVICKCCQPTFLASDNPNFR